MTSLVSMELRQCTHFFHIHLTLVHLWSTRYKNSNWHVIEYTLISCIIWSVIYVAKKSSVFKKHFRWAIPHPKVYQMTNFHAIFLNILTYLKVILGFIYRTSHYIAFRPNPIEICHFNLDGNWLFSDKLVNWNKHYCGLLT